MITIPLEYPVEFGGATYSELTLGRLDAGALAKIEAEMRLQGLDDGDKIRSSIILISASARIPDDVVRLLDATDFNAANEAVADFLSSRARSRGKPRK
jgi:hypothetical protein